MNGIYDRALSSIERQRFESWMDVRQMMERKAPYLKDYRLTRAIDNMAHELRTGLEYEVHQDMERGGHRAQHGGIVSPFEIYAEPFIRADTVGSVTAGGYLVETINLDAADALRPTMIAGGLGCTFIPAPYGANVNIPKQSGVGTAGWVTTETATISETDQVFGQAAGQPHTVGAYTEVSRLLTLQAAPSPAEFVVRRDLVSTVGRALDLGVFFGSGVAGQVHGLAGLTGVQTFSGTAMSLTSITNAAVALGDGLDDSAGVAANRTTAGLLKTRPESAGSTRLLWEGSLIAGSSVGFPARSTSALSAGSFFIGSFRFVNVVVWGSGIEIVANPFGDSSNTNFQKGIIGVRGFLTADVVVTYPAAFNYASTTT
jgi:HK97 family phage major capsid protein